MGISGLLYFQMNFYIIISISEKNVVGIRIGIVLNLYITFGNMFIFVESGAAPQRWHLLINASWHKGGKQVLGSY